MLHRLYFRLLLFHSVKAAGRAAAGNRSEFPPIGRKAFYSGETGGACCSAAGVPAFLLGRRVKKPPVGRRVRSYGTAGVLAWPSPQRPEAQGKGGEGGRGGEVIHHRVAAGEADDGAQQHGADAHAHIAADVESGDGVGTPVDGSVPAGDGIAGGT